MVRVTTVTGYDRSLRLEVQLRVPPPPYILRSSWGAVGQEYAEVQNSEDPGDIGQLSSSRGQLHAYSKSTPKYLRPTSTFETSRFPNPSLCLSPRVRNLRCARSTDPSCLRMRSPAAVGEGRKQRASFRYLAWVPWCWSLYSHLRFLGEAHLGCRSRVSTATISSSSGCRVTEDRTSLSALPEVSRLYHECRGGLSPHSKPG